MVREIASGHKEGLRWQASAVSAISDASPPRQPRLFAPFLLVPVLTFLPVATNETTCFDSVCSTPEGARLPCAVPELRPWTVGARPASCFRHDPPSIEAGGPVSSTGRCPRPAQVILSLTLSETKHGHGSPHDEKAVRRPA